MALDGGRTYMGFGFGPIQAGLFLYEAYRSGAFGRLVVAEILPERVHTMRRAGGYFALNIAHADGIEQVEIGPVELLNPRVGRDREWLTEAVAAAQEIGTAIPSTAGYVTAGAASLHRVLADGLAGKIAGRGDPAVIYAAENDMLAAEKLAAAVGQVLNTDQRRSMGSCACFVNTVIGKMSGLTAASERLRPITPAEDQAFLVEAFNRIYISQIRFANGGVAQTFRPGLALFEEKVDLRPFEEAKLYGHNAVHALAAYLGILAGATVMPDLRRLPGMVDFLRDALLLESGPALMVRFAGTDPMFRADGFVHAGKALLERILNPYLQDSLDRVARDPARKLGWNDRLIGVMRRAVAAGIRPVRYAMGAAAAMAMLQTHSPAIPHPTDLLDLIWAPDSPAPGEVQEMVSLIEEGNRRLLLWQAQGGDPRDVIREGVRREG